MSTDAVMSSGGGGSSGGGSSGGSTGASTGGGSTAAAVFSWQDGWRNQLAKTSTDPEKELKQLERYESPEAVWRKARELERRMSSGELRTSLKKDATTQEVAAWRAENGIPAKPEEYKVNMPAGKQPPKEDDAFLKAFQKHAHDANYTQPQFDAAVSTFYAQVDQQIQSDTEAEKKAVETCEEQLRKDWGGDYKTNKAMADALLDRAPSGFKDRILNGYTADGAQIKADPATWKWLVQLERELNPFATVVPGGGSGSAATVEARINELKGLMGNQNSKYWKGPEAEKLQEEYRNLVTARDRAAQKAA